MNALLMMGVIALVIVVAILLYVMIRVRIIEMFTIDDDSE